MISRSVVFGLVAVLVGSIFSANTAEACHRGGCFGGWFGGGFFHNHCCGCCETDCGCGREKSCDDGCGCDAETSDCGCGGGCEGGCGCGESIEHSDEMGSEGEVPAATEEDADSDETEA